MRIIRTLILTAALLFAYPALSQDQCSNFALSVLPQLDSQYISTGRNISLAVTEGSQVTVVKTFDRNVRYKIMIRTSKPLSDKVIVIIKDKQGNLIYDNRKHKLQTDFELHFKEGKFLRMYITVPQIHDPPKKGCVAVIIGMRKD